MTSVLLVQKETIVYTSQIFVYSYKKFVFSYNGKPKRAHKCAFFTAHGDSRWNKIFFSQQSNTFNTSSCKTEATETCQVKNIPKFPIINL